MTLMAFIKKQVSKSRQIKCPRCGSDKIEVLKGKREMGFFCVCGKSLASLIVIGE